MPTACLRLQSLENQISRLTVGRTLPPPLPQRLLLAPQSLQIVSKSCIFKALNYTIFHREFEESIEELFQSGAARAHLHRPLSGPTGGGEVARPAADRPSAAHPSIVWKSAWSRIMQKSAAEKPTSALESRQPDSAWRRLGGNSFSAPVLIAG